MEITVKKIRPAIVKLSNIIHFEVRFFRNERLFTPGPVEIPEGIRTVLSAQIIHHRTPEFRDAFLEVRDLFKSMLEDDSDNFVFFASSGTGAMEAAVLNFFKRGEKVISVVGGKFGERWSEIARLHGLEVIDLEVEWGKSVDPQMVGELLKKNPDCRGVLIQASESSTGAFHDIKSVGRIVKDSDALLVVDAITALGVYRIVPSLWNIDILVGGSQKAFMLPPGLSMLWFSERARERLFRGSYYFNVSEEVKKQSEGQTSFTPAISLILGLRESLRMLIKEGMEGVERRYRLISQGVITACERLGLKLLAENPSISLTALLPPEGLEAEDIRREMIKMGVRVAGGQGPLKGRIIRISHMGMDYLDMTVALSSLEMALRRLGRDTIPGSGVGAYLEVISAG